MAQTTDNPTPTQLKVIQRRVRTRFLCSAVVIVLYGCFALGYGPLQRVFADNIAATSSITFGMVYFAFLVLLFLLIEFCYLKLADRGEQDLHTETPSQEKEGSTAQ